MGHTCMIRIFSTHKNTSLVHITGREWLLPSLRTKDQKSHVDPKRNNLHDCHFQYAYFNFHHRQDEMFIIVLIFVRVVKKCFCFRSSTRTPQNKCWMVRIHVSVARGAVSSSKKNLSFKRGVQCRARPALSASSLTFRCKTRSFQKTDDASSQRPRRFHCHLIPLLWLLSSTLPCFYHATQESFSPFRVNTAACRRASYCMLGSFLSLLANMLITSLNAIKSPYSTDSQIHYFSSTHSTS